MASNWGSGNLTYNELNIGGNGVDMSVVVAGETNPGILAQIQGGNLNGVSGLDLRTNGFTEGTGITATYMFSVPISSADFEIGHINTETNPPVGDKLTVTALDSLGNTVSQLL